MDFYTIKNQQWDHCLTFFQPSGKAKGYVDNFEMLQTTLTNPNDNDMEKLGMAFALHCLVYI